MNAPEKLPAFTGIDPQLPAIAGASAGSYSAEMPNEAYHAVRTHISRTGMSELLRSPMHYLTYLQGGGDGGVAPNFGSAAHCAVLEPDEFEKKYVLFSGRRQGKAFDEFVAANPGKQILNLDEKSRLDGIVKALRDFKDFPILKALRSGEVEKSIFWQCEETGAHCRVRLDALSPFVIFDLKSYGDVRPDAVLRQVMASDYDLQAYMYSAGYKAYAKETLPFMFVFVEDKPPHGVWMYTAGASLMESGREKFLRGARAFTDLANADLEQCYSNALTILEAPKWRKRELSARAAENVVQATAADTPFL